MEHQDAGPREHGRGQISKQKQEGKKVGSGDGWTLQSGLACTLAQSWAQGNVHLQANRMTTVAHPRDGKQATDTRHNVEEPSKSC